MKYIILIFILFVSYNVCAQTRPVPPPTQYSTGFFIHGYHKTDSGSIIAIRPLTGWLPRYTGTVVFNSVDRRPYFYDSTDLQWYKFLTGTDTLSLSNRINLKLNISDTTNKWWGIGRRWVDSLYRVNDSTIGYTINGLPYTFQILGRLPSGGGGSGTVTSVGLSLPSAFNVTPSTITTSGTFAVTGAGTTAQYIRGNGTLATTDTGMIPNFHLKVRGLMTGSSPITFNQTTGVIGINNANTSGTKGAATFSSSSFSDNGSGTISLVDVTTAGSCINCDITFDAKGRAISFASGTPPQFVNAPGAGDTLSRSDTLKRLNPGYGILHTLTDNNITHRVDTGAAGLATQYDLTQIPAVSLNNIGAGYRWLSTPTGNYKSVSSSNTILWDSTSTANTLTAKADTSVLATQFDISQLPSGSGAANQITYWTGLTTQAGDAGMTVNATTNTIITDSTRLLQLVVAGDSTVTSKIVFSPIKPRPGPMPWRIGLDEQNNQYNGGATIDPVFEIKYGALNGTGKYLRTAWEGSWLPFPGATYEQAEMHVLEIGYGPALGNLIIRPLAWTGSWNGDDGTWSHRANLHAFYDWNGQKDLGGFSRGVGEFKAYYNYSGAANLRMLAKDTGTSINIAGFQIEGQIAAGLRNSATTHYGQSITQQFETGPVFRSNKGGQGYSSGWNYVFNILDTNTNHVFIFTKGGGLFDNVYAWMHNDGRFVSGDAGNFFSTYKFQAKPQGSNTLAFVAGNYDASNNTILRISSFAHALTSGSGAGASGMGAGFDFRADNSANTLTAIGDISAAWESTPTAGAENGYVAVRTKRAGTLTEAARYKSTGQVQWATYTTSNFLTNDTTNYKPAVIDASGNIHRMAGWPTGGAITTLYTGDGTVAGNRNVNVNNLNLTFSDVNTFRINHDVLAQSRADGTFPYSNAIIAPSQQLWMAYTPSVGNFSKGSAIIIDTNENVSLGTGFITSSHPLYTYGSAYAQGFTSARGNFYRVDNYTANQTLTIEQYWINVDATSGNVTVTLPAASTAFGSGVGIQYVIRRVDNSGNTVTISRAGSDLINGATTTALSTQYEVKEIQAVSSTAWAIK